MKPLVRCWDGLYLIGAALTALAQIDDARGFTSAPFGVATRPAQAPGTGTEQPSVAVRSGGYRSIQLASFTRTPAAAFPFFITAEGNRIYVSDASGNKIDVYTIGTSIGFTLTLGSTGAGPGQFSGPEQSAVIGNELLVADFTNNRVQRFNKSTGAYIGQFGSAGAGPGQFSNPAGLAYNPSTGAFMSVIWATTASRCSIQPAAILANLPRSAAATAN